MLATGTPTHVQIEEPVRHDVRYSLEHRDQDPLPYAVLDDSDLDELWRLLPSSPTERGEIECYLCSVAEAKHTKTP